MVGYTIVHLFNINNNVQSVSGIDASIFYFVATENLTYDKILYLYTILNVSCYFMYYYISDSNPMFQNPSGVKGGAYLYRCLDTPS